MCCKAGGILVSWGLLSCCTAPLVALCPLEMLFTSPCRCNIPSFVANIQPAEQARVFIEACAGNKGQVRLLILKRQKENSARGYLRFRIYYTSCTDTSAFYFPCGLG